MAGEINLGNFKALQANIMRFMLTYQFAIEEMETKLNILKEEFKMMHEYNPIEHVSTRLKSPESILKKIAKKGCGTSMAAIKESIRDIAGVRITCSFVEDIYKVSQMIQRQRDVTLIDAKDYIETPKANGYRSLHLIVSLPIFMSDRVEDVYVELQIRTIAMDFWASLEHKIYYKYNKDVPDHIREGLKEAAVSAAQLDRKMEDLNREINILKSLDDDDQDIVSTDQVQKFAQRLLIKPE